MGTGFVWLMALLSGGIFVNNGYDDNEPLSSTKLLVA